MTYHEREQYIYDQLVNSQNETGFYFSLRINGSKNARRDIFIGTEKSNYFKFSVWNVPIGFAGSSGNFMDFCIYNKSNDLWSYKFESSIPKNVTGDQNKLSLAFLKKLVDRLSNEFSEYKHYVTQDHNKMYFISIEQEMGYKSFEKLTSGLIEFMRQVIPIIDSLMDEFKSSNTEWNAHRYTVEEWEKFNKDYQRRLKKYPIAVLKQEETEEEEDTIELVNPIKPNHPNNQILYGPPGTGKTFKSINLALDILGAETKDKNRSEIISEYEDYRKSGQIAFTTFHQSMAYEDFIEGIKPSLDDIENDVSYEISDGILKSMAKLAIQEYVKWGDHDNMSFETRYDKLLELVNDSDSGYIIKTKTGNNLILEEVTPRENIKVRHENGLRNYRVSKTRLEKVFHGLSNLESITNINKAIRNIIGGSNATSYWAVNEVLHKMEGEKEDYKINPHLTDLQLENIIKQVDWREASDLNVDRYVLIIDEVNRGNVSAIFGELITLLEDDKRLDQTNKIVLKLPYSKTDFGLPSNLYIVATMNTADRSVEALDTALRRRFSFKEILPDIKVISSQPEEKGSDDIEGINLTEVLKTLNERIELLLDKDHMIGHSYFLKINDQEGLKDTFKNKIIPLLQEYFYNDYQKLVMVLGEGFVTKKKIEFNTKLFAGNQNQIDIDLPEFSYDLKTINKDFDILSALRSLLNLSAESGDEG